MGFSSRISQSSRDSFSGEVAEGAMMTSSAIATKFLFCRNIFKLTIKRLISTAFSVTMLSDMVQVTRKDSNEANENIIRRFNRKVLQSGVLARAKGNQRFSKPISKTERRKKAIIRKERKAEKLLKTRLGTR